MGIHLQKQKNSIPQYNKRILPIIKNIMHMSYEENIQKSVTKHTKKINTVITFITFWKKHIYIILNWIKVWLYYSDTNKKCESYSNMCYKIHIWNWGMTIFLKIINTILYTKILYGNLLKPCKMVSIEICSSFSHLHSNSKS